MQMEDNAKETEKEITQWELVEIILGEEPEKRDRYHIEQLLPWFKDRSAFFRMLEEGINSTSLLIQHQIPRKI